MTDWADGIEIRNYGIKNETDTHMLSELMRIIVTLAMVAGAFLYYSWIRSQIINTGYESQNLFTAEQSLLRTQKSLMLEEEILRAPERIDIIARNELGMTPLRPSQLIPPQIQDVERSAFNEMAMADSKDVPMKRFAGIKRLGDYSN